MKILTIVGARPQFIKASAVSRALAAVPDIHETLVHTGQHYDYGMSEVFFDELNIPQPHYNLGIGSGTHGQQTGKMLIEIEQVLLKEKPDIVVVYGDTNSTLAGAIAAAKLHISIAHVEAGLRSFNRQMPEEINRVLTDHVSDYLFTPTDIAAQHLKEEGLNPAKIFPVGDVMYDVALYSSQKAEKYSHILETLNLKPKSFCLTTIHRAENTDNHQRLKNIFDALIELSKTILVVLPLHPRTRKALKETDYFEQVEQSMQLIEPIGYLDMINLERNARLILTDSGGVQKEAFFFKVPAIVLRDETEWIELLDIGFNRLVPPSNKLKMLTAILEHLSLDVARHKFPNLYGDGNAADKISKIISDADI